MNASLTNWKTALTLIAAAACSIPVYAAQPSASFTVTQLTAIPGKTLPPGGYTIHVVDHLSDRYILEVQGANGGDQTLFLAVPDAHLTAHSAGKIAYANPANGAGYLRGWRFAGMARPLEFVYPKADAVAVAQANHDQVPAIDPSSDNLNAEHGQLSQSQMQIVTLWLLTPTKVGPSSPAGISAARYSEVASVKRPPVVKALPHTASLLPWLWIAGTCSLLAALGFRTLAWGETRGRS